MQILTSFANWLFQTSLKASILAGFILLIQFIFRKKLSPQWRYALWLLLLVRLVLPFEIESRLSVFNWIEVENFNEEIIEKYDAQVPFQFETLPESKPETPPVLKNETSRAIQFAQVESENSQQTIQGNQSRLTIIDYLSLIWILGVLLFTFTASRANIRLWRKVKNQQPIQNPSLLALLEKCRKNSNIKRKIVLVELEEIQSPMLFGCWQPRILLPEKISQRLSGADLTNIFMHELAHLKRGDLPVAWLATVLQILHWFNPVIWFAFYRMREDRELACDAMTIGTVGAENSTAYGQTIVNLLTHISTMPRQPLTVGILENQKNLERRLGMIATFKKHSIGWSLVGFSLLLMLSCLALTKHTPIVQPYLNEAVIKVGYSDSVNVNNKIIPIENLAEELNGYRINENSVVTILPLDSVRIACWFDVFTELQNTAIQKTKYVNQQTGKIVLTNKYPFGEKNLRKIPPEKRLFPKEKGGKYGFVNRDEEVVIPFRFEKANMFLPGTDFAGVKLNGKWGCINSLGKIVIEPQFEKFHGFNDGMGEVKIDGKWGYIDTTGQIVIKPVFDVTYLFIQGYALTVRNGKHLIIDKTGKVAIPPKYDYLLHYKNGLIPAQINGKWGYLDINNNVVIDFRFDEATMFDDELARVCLNGQYGYINKKGELVIPPKYQEAERFQGGLAPVRMSNGKYGYIDFADNLVIEPQFDVAFPFESGTAMAIIFENPVQNIKGQGIRIDKAGNIIERRSGR